MKEGLVSFTLIVSTFAFIICLLILIVYLFKRDFKAVKTSSVFLGISVLFWLIAAWNLEGTVDSPEEAIASEEVVEYDESLSLNIEEVVYDSSTELVTITAKTNAVDGTKITFGLLHEETYERYTGRGEVSNELVQVQIGEGEYIQDGNYSIDSYIAVDKTINPEFFERYGNGMKITKSVEIVDGEVTTFEDSTDEEYIVQFIEQGPFKISGAYSAEEVAQKEHEEELKEAQEKKANAQELRFAELNKNPDKHVGVYLKYQGEILQIMEDENSTELRLAVTKDAYGYDYNDVVYVTFEGTTPFLDEDIVTIYGTVSGAYTYESTAGYQITLPLIEAEIIE